MELMPLFLNLNGRAVVLVGGGRVAAGKLQQLLAVGARVNMGDAHDARGGSNGAQREPLTKGEPAAEATSGAPVDLGVKFIGGGR